MDWFKMYSEARADKKLGSLRREQRWVWFCLMCVANEQEDRGTIPGMKPRLLALEVADGDVDLMEDTIAELMELDILDEVEGGGYRFLKWEARQRLKPSDAPERVRERVTRHREAKRTATNEDVTPRNAPVTRSNAVDKIREDKIKTREEEEVKAARASAAPSLVEPSSKKKCRIPVDFSVTNDMRKWADDLGITALVDLDDATEEFRDYWRGEGGSKVDWVATWQNSMRKKKDYALRQQKGGNGNGRNGHQPDNKGTRNMAKWAKIEANLKQAFGGDDDADFPGLLGTGT